MKAQTELDKHFTKIEPLIQYLVYCLGEANESIDRSNRATGCLHAEITEGVDFRRRVVPARVEGVARERVSSLQSPKTARFVRTGQPMNITIFHVCEGLTAMPQPHESDSMLHT